MKKPFILIGIIILVTCGFVYSLQNKDCSSSARDYFATMKPPARESNDPQNPYTLQQSKFNFLLNTCVVEVTYGSQTYDYPSKYDIATSYHDIIYDVYKNKQLAINTNDSHTPHDWFKNNSNKTYCKTLIGDGLWINKTCQEANQKFDDYKKSIGL